MTVPLDASLCLTAGHIFAVAGAEPMKESPEKAAECLNRSRIFTATVVAPVSLCFLFRWPHWSWMYTVRNRPRRAALVALASGLLMCANELGYRNAARLIVGDRDRAAAKEGAATLSLPLLIGLVGIRRLLRLGTIEEFEAGEAKFTLFSLDFLASVSLAGLAAVAGALYVFVKNACQRGSRHRVPGSAFRPQEPSRNTLHHLTAGMILLGRR